MSGFINSAQIDIITNNGSGGMGDRVASGQYTLEPSVGFDPGILRPVIQTDGKVYCVINTGRTETKNGRQVPIRQHVPILRLIHNGIIPHTYNTSALPYRTWEKIDRAAIKAARDRLQAWADLEATEVYGGFDGMATTALIRDTLTDPGDAKVDMDTLTDDLNDAPLATPDILPLPIIHAGAFISQRRQAQSQNGGMPLDTTMVEAAGRRCAETLEKMTIGTLDLSDLVIGSSTTFDQRGIYGYRTHDDRITKTDVTASSSFVPNTFVEEVIAMIELARAQKLHGPFVLYYSTSWDQYLARDYYNLVVSGSETGVAAPRGTVLQRVEQIRKIQSVKALDLFTNTDELLLVQMTSETVRAVNGMDFTPVQWSEDGGAKIMLRVMGIKVPDLRSQYVGTSVTAADRVCGVVHGTTA